MRYSIIDTNTCLKYTFYDTLCLHTTNNPIISYVENIKAPEYLTLGITTMNRIKPVITSTSTYEGITYTYNGNNTYHIQGTANSTYYYQLYDNKCNEIPNQLLETNLIIEVTNNQGETPIFIKDSDYSGSNNTLDIGITTYYGNYSSLYYINFKYNKGKTYNFDVKVWSTLPEENPNNDFYPYIAPISLPTREYNGRGYNILIPRQFLNMPAIITSTNAAARNELLYNPDYEFNYRTITEEMDLLEIPAYTRPFSGYTTGQTINYPDYPVKGIRYWDWPSSGTYTNVIGYTSLGDFKYTNGYMFDEAIADQSGDTYLYYNLPNANNSSNYNFFSFPSAPSSSKRMYEWIIGDPPLELATD